MTIDFELFGKELPDFKPAADFYSPKDYIVDKKMRYAVNIAVATGQPLLVTGEPGTGKTQLAAAISYHLGLGDPLIFNTKTTSVADDLFYQYDALTRFHDIQFEKIRKDVKTYLTYQAVGKAILLTIPFDQRDDRFPDDLKEIPPKRSVVLIDEIDKAPRDLPNDVLNEIERMEFTVKEMNKTFKAVTERRPILILTSNSEKNLPDPFLRRCIFYHIPFPDEDQLKEIARRRLPDLPEALIEMAVPHFYQLRRKNLKKDPATAEFLTWLTIVDHLKIKDFNKLTAAEADLLAASYTIIAKTQEDLEKLQSVIIKKDA